MKIKTLLITSMLSSAIILPAYAADSITAATIKQANLPISNAEIADPRVGASAFIEHVNYARVALAMKNTDLAKQHIIEARNVAAFIKDTPTEKLRITEVQSGRVIYQYETEYKYHYFPINAGPVQVKTIDNGALWAKNSLAVSDADIVYLSLDLTGNKVESYLTASEKAITAGNLKEAGNQLAKLTEVVVTVNSETSVPSDKAHDNIALARNFLAGKNYNGANYALKHADEALDEMLKADAYKEHREEIVAMRKDVSDLQSYIAKKDPTMIQKADAKMDKWWKELKTWSKTTK